MRTFRSFLSLSLAGIAVSLAVCPMTALAQRDPLTISRDQQLPSDRPDAKADADTVTRALYEIQILEARIALKKAEIAEVDARSRRYQAREKLVALIGKKPEDSLTYKERLTLNDVTRASVPFPETIAIEGKFLTPKESRIKKAIIEAVDAKNQPILDALARKVVMAFPDKTPLEDVLKYLRTATKGDKLPNGIPIFVDPTGLPDAEGTVRKAVTIKADDLALKDSLGFVLRQVGLSWKVKDGLLVISDKNQAVLDAMDNKVVMAFPDKTPLEDVLKYLRVATKNDNLPIGIPIFVDPSSISDPELTMRKVVTIKADDLALKESLTLVLRQVGLTWTVKDGLLVICAPDKNVPK